ncbi:hypothetical protein Lepto7376_0210 [[Leptolyngbya] sp. PCC 7376]|nr:hypothetical protein Lepto7376_0210 [[Leptolyngbya] sp. PCC 7376]
MRISIERLENLGEWQRFSCMADFAAVLVANPRGTGKFLTFRLRYGQVLGRVR